MTKHTFTSCIIAAAFLLSFSFYSNAQQCTNIQTFGGVGPQSASGIVKDGCSYVISSYGIVKDGKSSGITLDGITYPNHYPIDRDYDRSTNVACIFKLNPDNSVAWCLAQSSATRHLMTITPIKVEVDDNGDSFILLSLSDTQDSNNKITTLYFGGEAFPLEYGGYALIKVSPDGKILWKYGFSKYNSFGLDGAGNPVILFKSNWDYGMRIYDAVGNETTIRGVKGHQYNNTIVRFDNLAGSFVATNLNPVFGVSKDEALIAADMSIVPSNNNLCIKYYYNKDGIRNEILYIENGGTHTMLSTKNENATHFIKSPYSGNYYLFYDHLESHINYTGVQKLDNNLQSLAVGKFTRSGLIHHLPAIDKEDNLIIYTTSLYNKDNRWKTLYNDTLLYIPERDGGGYFENHIYLDKNLDLIGQYMFGRKPDNGFMGNPWYDPNTNTFKSIGKVKYVSHVEFSPAIAYTADYGADIGIYDYDNKLIFPKMDGITYVKKKTFTLKQGEEKEMSAAFTNYDPLNISWFYDGQEVSTTNKYTIKADRPGDHNLILKAVNPKRPAAVYEKTWAVNVSNYEAELILDQQHPLYHKSIDRTALDTVNNAIWAISTDYSKIRYIQLDSVELYETYEKPANFNFGRSEIRSAITDYNGELYLVTKEGELLSSNNKTWKMEKTIDLGITGEPNQLFSNKKTMYLGTRDGLWKKENDAWSKVQNIALTSPNVPSDTYSTWGKPEANVQCMTTTPDGELWLGLGAGITNISLTDSLFPQSKGMPFNHAYAMATSGKYMYFGGASANVFEYNTETKQFRDMGDVSEDIPYHALTVFEMKTDNDGNVWFVNNSYGYGDGIFCLNPETKRITHHLKGTSVSAFFNISPDNEIIFSSSGDLKKLALPKPNTVPVSVASTIVGQPRKVGEGDSIRLYGADSHDADKDELTYTWSISPHPEYAVFSDAHAVNPTLVVHIPAVPDPNDTHGSQYWVQLIVADDQSADTSMFDMSVKGNFLPPVINIANSDNLFVDEGGTLIVDGSGSYDPETENNLNCTFTWKFILDGKETILPSDSAKVIIDGPTVYKMKKATLMVKATDGEFESDWKTVEINIKNTLPAFYITASLKGEILSNDNFALYAFNMETGKGEALVNIGENTYPAAAGKWKVFALPTQLETHNFIPTYAHSSAISYDAQVVVLGESTKATISLDLIPYGVSEGSGSVSGNAKKQSANEVAYPNGIALFNRGVVIYSLPDTIAVSYTITDANGDYKFSDLNWGKYLIALNHEGVSLDDAISVELSAEAPMAINQNFLLDATTPSKKMDAAPVEMIAYPNPTTNMLYFKGIKDGLNTIEIYNTTGKLIQQNKTNLHQISLNELKSGVYFIKVQTSKTEHKIIKINKF